MNPQIMGNRMSSTSLAASKVCIYRTASEYPMQPPFGPPQRFPEYPFNDNLTDPANAVYAGVRSALHLMGLDGQHYGSSKWNPLGQLVSPGQRVIIKPNLVVDSHPLGSPGINAAVVHGSVLRPIIDYVWLALRGEGEIIIADSPIKEVDFARILDLTGINPVVHWLSGKGVPVSTLDVRDLQADRDARGILVRNRHLPGDPEGYAVLDLKESSVFADLPSRGIRRLRSTAAFYENAVGQAHTTQQQHCYSVARTILSADVIISVAKLKTHKKAGVTLSLKNAVGITNEKRWLPHHRIGSPSNGGDMHDDRAPLGLAASDALYDFLSRRRWGRAGFEILHSRLGGSLYWYLQAGLDAVIPSRVPSSPMGGGNWYGNDTVWRMVVDLNRILVFADREGDLNDNQPRRRYFSVIDGIVAGEGDGPLVPTPKPCGVLLMGANPAAVDIVGSSLMGFDFRKIRSICEAAGRLFHLNANSIETVSNVGQWRNLEAICREPILFLEPPGWEGYLVSAQ